MGLVDKLGTGVSRIVWKGVKHAGTAVAGFLSTVAMKKVGIELSPDHQLQIAVAVTGALGALLKLAKNKLPKQLGWL